VGRHEGPAREAVLVLVVIRALAQDHCSVTQTFKVADKVRIFIFI